MSTHSNAETIEAHGCRVVLRRVEGDDAKELFFACQPTTQGVDAGEQTEAIYRAILDILVAEGADFESVVSETLFVRSLRPDIERIREARERVLSDGESPSPRPVTLEIEQPPLDEGARLEVAVQALLPRDSPLHAEVVPASSDCQCVECAQSYGLKVEVAGESRLYAGALFGRGPTAYEQTLAMFSASEDLLKQAGMNFQDVVRTWIHIRDIDADYHDLNRARREFFASRNIDQPPASTGIGGGAVPDEHVLSLGVYAVKSATPPERAMMTTPTLNEAGQYGADFVRGMKMVEANKVALHVSGTASVDEAGRTAHLGDFEAQVDRMLVNVAGLLERQGASFRDVVSGVTYLKHPENAAVLRAKFREAGFDDFPNVLVAAHVCRPELLCETEVLAVLPRAV